MAMDQCRVKMWIEMDSLSICAHMKNAVQGLDLEAPFLDRQLFSHS